MSKQIEERVVSMQFDNARFEKNVQTSMSTLDKLKQKLNLSGASKGLETVQTAAKKVDMSGLANGVETVRSRFSALEVMGVTALANITNSAVNAGKRMIAALTIDPVKTGFNEYELKMNSVQTIMASTGESLKTVNKYLDELNTYSDKTIYSFSDMTQNIGKFTNAGVKLEDAVLAMKGISNEAALSGANANEASRAMYNFAQALSVGYIQRIDWKSIELANMATVEFKEQLLESAIAAGTVKKSADGMYSTIANPDKAYNSAAMFTETLDDQWLTTEVLIGTLKDYADETTDIGKRATKAATEIKTFSQMIDTLKESAQSGWARTWEILFGDFEAGKKLWTSIGNAIGGVIDRMTKFRNAILESALGRGFTDLSKKIKSIIDPVKESVKSVKGAVDTVKDYSKLVDEIIAGKWGNAPTRWQELTKAGYDWAHAQNLVNERLGCSVRHATKYKEAQDGINKSQKKASETTSELTKEEAARLAQLIKMSDEELKALGYTNEQIDALRELEKTAKKLGIPIDEFLAKINEIDGRWLFLETFANIGRSISGVFKAMGQAWQEIFNPKKASMVQKIADVLFNVIAALHRFSRSLLLTDTETGKLNENGEKLKRTFKGIFAIFDLVLTVVGGPLKIAFKILSAILKAFDLNILDITAVIGDALVKFRDWTKKILDFTKVFEWMAPYIKKAASAMGEWVKAAAPLEKISNFFKKVGDAFKEWVKGLKETDNIPQYIIQGLVNGLKAGVSAVWNAIKNIGLAIIESICNVLGIHSPSKEMEKIGRWTIEGFLQGIKNGASNVWDALKNFGVKCINIIKKIDLGAVIAAATTIGMTVAFNKIGTALASFASTFEGLGDFLEDAGIGIKRLFTGIGKWFKAGALEKRSKAILNFAIAIGILSASLYVLTKIKDDGLWEAIGAITVLSLILIGLSIAISKLNGLDSATINKTGVNVKKTVSAILPIAAALLLVASAVKKLAVLKPEELDRGVLAITALGLLLTIMTSVVQDADANFNKSGNTILKIALSISLLAYTVKMISKLEPTALGKGIGFMILFGAFIVGMIAATKLAGPHIDGLGKTIFKIAGSILILALTARIIGGLDSRAMVKGMLAIVAFGLIIAGLIKVVSIGSDTQIAKVGKTIMAISVAMLLMTASVSILGNLNTETLAKGTIAVGLFGLMIIGLINAIKASGGDTKGIARSILAVSVAIGILAAVSVLLGLVQIKHLVKGIIAVGLLSTMMAVLVRSLKDAKDCMGSLIVLTVAIVILTGAIGVLSAIDPQKLGTATLALSSVLGMFAVMTKSTSGLKGIKNMIAPLGLMLGVVVVLAGVLVALSALNVNVALQTTTGLSLLMLSMSASLVILSAVGKFAKDSLMGVLALTAMAIPLLAFVGVLALMQNVQNATANVLALTILATAMSLLLIPLSIVGAMGMAGLPFIGVLALTAMAIPLLAFVGVLALMQNIQNATANAMLLVDMMTAIGDVLFKISLVAPLAILGVVAITALSGLMVALGTLAVGIGYLMDKFPALQSFLDTGLPVLIQLAGGLGKMIGAFVGGIATELAASLPAIGESLSSFMEKVTPFIEGCKQVDESVGTGVGILVGAILGLTVSSFINGIADLLPFVPSMGELGAQLSQFMMNAMGFITGAKMIDPESVEAVKTLAECILIITGANLLEGITKFITGENSMELFGSQLVLLGTGLRGFINALGPMTDEEVATANCAAKIIKTLAEASAAIPNTGGLLGALVGDNDMGHWSAQLPTMAKGIADFTNTLTDAKLTTESVTLADNAAKMIKTLASAAAEIPNSGGLLASIVGDNEFSKWANELPNVGKGIAGFTNALVNGEISAESVELAKKGAEVVKVLAAAAQEVPNSGGLLASIVGDNDLSSFASGFPKVGKGVAGFAKELGEFSDAQLASVHAGVNAVKIISEMTDNYAAITDGGDFSSFGKGMVSLAKKIKEFTDKMSDVSSETVDAAVKKIKQVIELAKTVASTNIDSCKTFGKSLKSIAKDGVEGFVKEFKSDTPKKDIEKAAKAMMDAFGKAAEGKKDDVKKQAKKVAEAAVDVLDSKSIISDAKDAGKNVVTGFANGIKNNKSLASDAGSSLGKAALKAAKEALKEKSPSKEMYKVGDFAGIGFVNALYDNVSKAYKAGTKVADSAKNGISKAVSKIADVVNSDIDAQPTIRPVLDLSDVRSGAGAISSLFTGRTLAVDMDGIGSVSASMSNRQNGNGDVVNAIKGLRKDITNMPRNSYTFGNMTVEEGSDVAEGMKAIVRAMKLEGRA